VDQTSPGALDPQSSNYLFHSNSAAAKGTTTDRQNATMGDMNANTGSNIYTGDETPSMYRPTLDSDIITGNTGATSNTTDQGVMPEDTGVRNPLMPSETGTTNPVMPPEGTRNY